VFRTVYRIPSNQRAQAQQPTAVRELAGLLPFACDLRLALSVSQQLAAYLATLPGELTVQQLLARQPDDERFAGTLSRFRSSTTLAAIVTGVHNLHARIAQDQAFAVQVQRLVRQEWLAEQQINATVDLMYSAASAITVLTRHDKRYRFALKEFASGAVIANIVARAKKQAVKEALLNDNRSAAGISGAHLATALRHEFEENLEQFAIQKLQGELGLPGDELLAVELQMGHHTHDPWAEEKVRAYRLPALAER
jgi:hypothetical protein